MRRRWTLLAPTSVLALLVLAGCTGLSSPQPTGTRSGPVTSTAPAAPAPTLLWQEQFENGLDGTIGRVETYAGVQDESYTADEYWLRQDECNGFIVSAASGPGACDPALATMADAIGRIASGVPESDATTQANHVVTAWTVAGDPEAGDVMLTNSKPFSFTLPNPDDASAFRFLGGSIDASETGCDTGDPAVLHFEFSYDGGDPVRGASAITPCTDPRATVEGGIATGRFATPSTLLVDGGKAGASHTATLSLINLTTSGAGNDLAYDNLSLYDATPIVAPSFAPATASADATATLVLTVLNSTDLAVKDGWSFADTLPAGLVVADPSVELGGSCGATKDLSSDERTVLVREGSLAGGVASCTVTVEVKPETAPGAGGATFENCATQFSEQIGVDPSGCGTVTFAGAAGATGQLAITKTASATEAAPGDTLTFTVTAKNVGKSDYTTAAPALLVDELAGVVDDAAYNDDAQVDGSPVDLSGTRLSWSGPLAAGATATLSYSVTVAATPGDSLLRNVAFAPGTDAAAAAPACDGTDGTDPATGYPCAVLEVPVGSDEIAAIGIVKSTSFADTGAAKVGDVVPYRFEVTNQGTGTLVDVAISDSLVGSDAISYDWGGGAEGELAPGASVVATAEYQLTQSDLDSGVVVNTATVDAATKSKGEAVTAQSEPVTIELAKSPGLTLTKSHSGDISSYAAGAVLHFEFLVENTGNVTLTDLELSDRMPGLGPITVTDGNLESLAPGETVTAGADYVLNQDDIDNGTIENDATVTAHDGRGSQVSASDRDTVKLRGDVALELRVTSDVVDHPDRPLAEQVVFSYVATNTGEMPLTEVVIRDTLVGLGPIEYGRWPGEPGELAPGEQITATATYTVTAKDARADQVTDLASASAVTTQGTPTEASGSEKAELTFEQIGFGPLVIALAILAAIVLAIFFIVRRLRKRRLAAAAGAASATSQTPTPSP